MEMASGHRRTLRLALLVMAGIMLGTGTAKLVHWHALSSGWQPWAYGWIAMSELVAAVVAFTALARWSACFALALSLGGGVLALAGEDPCGCAGPWLTKQSSHMLLAGTLGLSAVVVLRSHGHLSQQDSRRREPA